MAQQGRYNWRVPLDSDTPGGGRQIREALQDIEATMRLTEGLSYGPNATGTFSKTGVPTNTSTQITLATTMVSRMSVASGRILSQTPGFLLVSASVGWSALPGDVRAWAEWELFGGAVYFRNGLSVGEARSSVHALLPVTDTDPVGLNVYQASGGPLNVSGTWSAVIVGPRGGQPS